MLNTEVKNKEISLSSFNQIKKIQQALHNQIKVDKKNGDDPEYDTDFAAMDKSTCQIIDPGLLENLPMAIEDNDDLMIALNLDVSVQNDGTSIWNTGDNHDSDYASFDVKALSEEVDALVKSGRRGILQKIQYNTKLAKQLSNIQYKMNDVYSK